MRNLLCRLNLKSKTSIVLLCLVMACSTDHNIDIQGHRGCRGLMPENSIPAFAKAIELGVHTLELDIAITKDNEVVVSHEPYMNSVICFGKDGKDIPKDKDKTYNLYEMTHEEIKGFDCGSKVHSGYPQQEKIKVYKPLLSEVFDLVKNMEAKVNFNIEIKSNPEYYGMFTPKPKTYVNLVLKEIRAHGMTNRCSLQSFDLNILEEIKKQDAQIPVAILVDAFEDIDKKLNKLSFEPKIISPYFRLLSKEKLQAFHRKGFLVIPWTVNEVSDMKTLMNWKVDGIITDYPDRLVALLK